MAANSLLLFLLTTGLTTPPDQSVTTENYFDANIANTREDAARWYGQTQWPGYGGEPKDISVRWRQEPEYSTENPSEHFTVSLITDDIENDDIYWDKSHSQTERPFEESDDITDRPYDWPSATEETEDEIEEPQMLSEKEKKTCPLREHFTKCHKNCERTCSNYHERKACPKSCKKGCICDGALVRNKEGKCVPRDQCSSKNADIYWDISHSQTERPFEESEDRTYPPYDWPSATEEPDEETERPEINAYTTEEPDEETDQPEMRSEQKKKRTCPAREHFTKCHKNCERTCSNYHKRKACPKSCKKGCICDGALVRNKEGKCVSRDQCPNKQMADRDDDSHGCPYEYACDVYCITNGNKSGTCEGNVCKCIGRKKIQGGY